MRYTVNFPLRLPHRENLLHLELNLSYFLRWILLIYNCRADNPDVFGKNQLFLEPHMPVQLILMSSSLQRKILSLASMSFPVQKRSKAVVDRKGMSYFQKNVISHSWMQTMNRWSIFFSDQTILLKKLQDRPLIQHQEDIKVYIQVHEFQDTWFYLLPNTCWNLQEIC